ncbi:unnamed protein product [Prunus armeniaca]
MPYTQTNTKESRNSDEKKMLFHGPSPNTCKVLANEINDICGSPLADNLGKYLGMPLIHSRITSSTYCSLVDKVQKRLATWKSKLLSLPGRATQAVTAAIPIYAMQTVKVPMSICEELDRIKRNFFWEVGGDFTIRIRGCGLLKEKYLKGHFVLDGCLQVKHGSSSTWRAILHGSAILGKGDSMVFLDVSASLSLKLHNKSLYSVSLVTAHRAVAFLSEPHHHSPSLSFDCSAGLCLLRLLS